MFEELKKKSIKNSIVWLVFAFIIGGLMIGLNVSNLGKMMKGHVVFEELAPDEINDTLIVDATIKDNFGAFLERYEKNTKTGVERTTDLYYVIWTGDDYDTDYRYMAIRVPASYETRMEKMCENTYEGIVSSSISFSGKIEEMDSDEYKYFKEYFLESEFTEEEFNAETLPYYIYVDELTGSSAGFVYALVIGGAVIILASLIYIVGVNNGSKLKTIKKEIQLAGCSEARVESDYASATELLKNKDLCVGRMFTYYMDGATPHALYNENILWAYHNVITHRTNGIKTGTSYQVIVVTKDKKRHTINVDKENTAIMVLESMGSRLPWMIIGYSDELNRMFNKNFVAFLDLKYNKVEKTIQE